MRKRVPWPASDERFLREKYATIPARIIAAQINRTVDEVKDRARLFGLKSLPRDEKKKGTLYYYNGDPKFVVAPNGCWEWIASKNKKGYPTCHGHHSMLAHVQIYVERHGRLSWRLEVDHTCRNRGCVNPEHLEAVSHKENVRRGAVAKLNLEKAGMIRKSRQPAIELAKEYNVCVATIYHIKSRRIWR